MSRLIVITILVICARASAQTPTPTPAPPAPSAPAPAPAPAPQPPEDEAKRHFDQGVALFNDGNYSAALAEFEQAYKLRPQPFVLYNIALTQKSLFRYTDAIASLQKFLDESQNLAPEKRAEATQIIAEMKALLADVTLEITPANATIAIDGRVVGQTPIEKPVSIAAGTHKLEVTADGYEPQKRDLMITAGVPLKITLELKAIVKTGKVRINSAAPRAMVSIDGKAIGPVPVEVELEAGGHRLEVIADNYQTRRDELVVAAGQTRQLDVTLDKIVRQKKAWYKHWYVWAGAGAVLVGGATACTLAGCFDSRQSPVEGTLAPGAGGVE